MAPRQTARARTTTTDARAAGAAESKPVKTILRWRKNSRRQLRYSRDDVQNGKALILKDSGTGALQELTESDDLFRAPRPEASPVAKRGNMERGIELYAAIQLLVIGLSHVLQPHAWVEFFIALREKGRAGVFANGFLSLVFGSLVVSFHDVWTGWPMALTLLGWAQVIKSLIAFVLPDVAMRSFQRVSHERAWEFQVPGALFVVLAALMGYVVLRS